MVRVRHCLFCPFPLPFLSCSFPFSRLFLYASFSFSFPFSCPFSFPFSFPFPFLFLSFSFPLPFAFFFLSLSFSFPFPFPLPFLFFPFPSFTIPFSFPFPRSCEFFDQGVKPALGKTIRGKNDILEKPFERARFFFTNPHVLFLLVCWVFDFVWRDTCVCFLLTPMLASWNWEFGNKHESTTYSIIYKYL